MNTLITYTVEHDVGQFRLFDDDTDTLIKRDRCPIRILRKAAEVDFTIQLSYQAAKAIAQMMDDSID